MQKVIFILLPILYPLVYSSSKWTSNALAQYLNEQVQSTYYTVFLFDDSNIISKEFRNQITQLMGRVADEKNCTLFYFFLNELNLSQDEGDIEVFTNTLIIKMNLPNFIDRNNLLAVVVDRTNQLFAFQVGKKKNKELNNDSADTIISNGKSAFIKKQYAQGLIDIFTALNDFYFTFPTEWFLILVLFWTIIFSISTYSFYKKSNLSPLVFIIGYLLQMKEPDLILLLVLS